MNLVHLIFLVSCSFICCGTSIPSTRNLSDSLFLTRKWLCLDLGSESPFCRIIRYIFTQHFIIFLLVRPLFRHEKPLYFS